MNLFLIGTTLDTLGVVLIAYMALRVHHRVRVEHRIDEYVAREMRWEHALGMTGIALILLGYALEVISYVP